MNYAVAIEGLSVLRSFETLPKEIETAAIRAINKAADRARTSADGAIREQVAFPASYLRPSNGRLVVSDKASTGKLEAGITARQRPTSLARFATSPLDPSRRVKGGTVSGVSVAVAPGLVKFMRRVFPIRLRSGASISADSFNLGLAIRLKPGETVRNKLTAIQNRGNLALLYGPSVDQVFKTVRNDITPETLEFLEEEFLRLTKLEGIT